MEELAKRGDTLLTAARAYSDEMSGKRDKGKARQLLSLLGKAAQNFRTEELRVLAAQNAEQLQAEVIRGEKEAKQQEANAKLEAAAKAKAKAEEEAKAREEAPKGKEEAPKATEEAPKAAEEAPKEEAPKGKEEPKKGKSK